MIGEKAADLIKALGQVTEPAFLKTAIAANTNNKIMTINRPSTAL